MHSREEVVAAAFAAVDEKMRRAAVAQVGGFRPDERQITSSFGGRFVAQVGEEWPTNAGIPMIPLLQVRVDELPARPKELEGIALFNVFIGPKELPIDLPAENGNGWVLRSYSSLDGLSQIAAPKSHVKAFPVRWQLTEPEGPDWADAWEDYDMAEFNKLEDAIDLFFDRYKQSPRTKIGGWPSYCQQSPGSDGCVFQIGSEEKPNWMWGDNGTGQFYFRDGKWFMYWDCY